MNTRCHYTILLGMLLLMLAGCGFQLRGKAALPPQLNPLYLQSNDPFGQFSKTLQNLLKVNNVQLAPAPQDATYTLHIISANTESLAHTLSNDSSDSSQVYQLTYRVVYELLNQKGQRILGPANALAERSYTTNPSQVFGNSTALDSVKKGLAQQAAFQLLMQLSSQQTANALAQGS